jgi:beta-phosphoglucomutase-like phosphatase (HAD superfamily)
MDHFGFSEEDTFIIEDSPKGLAAANASGANVIQVKNPDEVNISLF